MTAPEAMLTIAPPAGSRAAAARRQASSATRLSSSMSRSWSSDVPASGRTDGSSVPPALLTQTSSRPSSPTARAASSSGVSPRRSATTSTARRPRDRTSSATAATSGPRRAVTSTSAPASASASAIARPIPRPEPVTTATRPSSENRSRTDTGSGPDAQPLLVEGVEVPNLALLVDAEGQARLAGRLESLLHGLEVELVLVEDPRQRPELLHRGAPRLVGPQAPLGGRRRALPGERREEQDLHDAALVVVAVGPPAVGDLVEAA